MLNGVLSHAAGAAHRLSTTKRRLQVMADGGVGWVLLLVVVVMALSAGPVHLPQRFAVHTVQQRFAVDTWHVAPVAYGGYRVADGGMCQIPQSPFVGGMCVAVSNLPSATLLTQQPILESYMADAEYVEAVSRRGAVLGRHLLEVLWGRHQWCCVSAQAPPTMSLASMEWPHLARHKLKVRFETQDTVLGPTMDPIGFIWPYRAGSPLYGFNG